MSIIYRIYRINNDLESINAAFDYRRKTSSENENEERNGYYDYIWEHEAKDKAYELNHGLVKHQSKKFPEVEFWYRVIEE